MGVHLRGHSKRPAYAINPQELTAKASPSYRNLQQLTANTEEGQVRVATVPNPSVRQLVAMLNRGNASCGSTRVALIDGPAGSGKTTLANRLAAALGGDPSNGAGTFDPARPASTQDIVQILHGDDMYEGWDGLTTLDAVLLGEVLRPLAAGDAAGFRMWDWVAGTRTHLIPVPPVQYLLIEGVGVAQREARPFANLVVYVDAPAEVRIRRGLERDGDHMRDEWERWQRIEDAHMREHDTLFAANAVIDGTSDVPD